MRRAVAAVLATAAMALLGTVVPAVAAPSAKSANLTAYLRGKQLPQDPLLHHLDLVRVVVTGFAPRAVVTVRLGGAARGTTRRASASGVVNFVYLVPIALPNGRYVLTFVGPAPPGRTGTSTATAGGDNQGIIVSVPNGGFFPFHIGDPGDPGTSTHTSGGIGGSSTAVSTSHDNTHGEGGNGIEGTGEVGAGGAGGAGKGLSHTGALIAGPLIAALSALVVGGLILRLSREPRKH